jgi:hypothetical protein
MRAIKRFPSESIVRHMVASIDGAPASEVPFYHLVLDNFFPAEVYQEMLDRMPTSESFRALPGRNNYNIREDGSSTRVKIDLFPEYLRHMDGVQKELWTSVGRALCAEEVRQAFVRRLAPGLKRRFGEAWQSVGMFPIPMLTRDTDGYRIPEHTDTRWKGITVQLYLPRDTSQNGIGTVFSERLPDGGFRRVTQMEFVPNHGYAFAVGDNTWHSVDAIGRQPKPRDSILHTYFVDDTVFKKLRNRGKRIGNFLRNEVRQAGR